VINTVIREITIDYKAHILILPIGSSQLMASEYVFKFLKDFWLPKFKIKKNEFDEKSIE
jgi:hypothetical protein